MDASFPHVLKLRINYSEIQIMVEKSVKPESIDHPPSPE
jgi:hypothetical protein